MITVVFAKKIVSIVLQILCIFGAVHATLNIISAKVLQSRLSLNICIFSCLNSFIVLAIFVAQILVGNIYYNTRQTEFFVVFIVNIIQIVVQFVAMVIMYNVSVLGVPDVQS
jgi:hypothetical protein